MRQPKVYVTDRDDNGKLFDGLVATWGDLLLDVELAPHLIVISKDGRTRVETPKGGEGA